MKNEPFYEKYNMEIQRIFNEDISLRDYPFKNKACYESHNSWHFSRVCIGWSKYEAPATAIQLYKDIIKVMDEKGISENVVCFFNNGNIEFREINEVRNEACEFLHNKSIEASDKYIQVYSVHKDYINELTSDLRTDGKGDNIKDGKERSGHIINSIQNSSIFEKFKTSKYKGHDLNNALVYKSLFNKDISLACIESVKEICSKHGDFTFITNEKKSEMNGYYCLFIIKND